MVVVVLDLIPWGLGLVGPHGTQCRCLGLLKMPYGEGRREAVVLAWE